jgi:hypothetical protein
MIDPAPTSELDLVVGSLFSTSPEEDRGQFEKEREWIYDIQDLLSEEGIEVDLLSRPGVEIWEGEIERYADLYQLRLLAAYLENGLDIKPIMRLDLDLEDEPDPLLGSIWDGEQKTRFTHLIHQQPNIVYYLPVDFDHPIWPPEFDESDDELDDEMAAAACSFGSSPGLQRELVDLENLLQQAGIKENSRPYRCLKALRAGADQSVANDLPLILW